MIGVTHHLDQHTIRRKGLRPLGATQQGKDLLINRPSGLPSLRLFDLAHIHLASEQHSLQTPNEVGPAMVLTIWSLDAPRQSLA